MSDATQPVQQDIQADQKSVTRFVQATRLLIKVISVALPLVFTWLTLGEISIDRLNALIAGTTATDVIWKSALVIFFFSWIWGVSYDTDTQELVYVAVPNRGRLPLHAIGTAVTIAVVLGVLFWVPSYQYFTIVLIAFLIINILAWRYLVRCILRDIIAASAARYRRSGDYFGLEKLRIVENYICGNWQWWRFGAGGLISAAMVFLSLADISGLRIPHFNIDMSASLLHSLTIFVFVAVIELWIWIARIQCRVSLDVLEDFRERYTILPAAPAAAPRGDGAASNKPAAQSSRRRKTGRKTATKQI